MDLFSKIYEDTIPQSTVIVRKGSLFIFYEVTYFCCGGFRGFFVLQIDKNICIIK